MQPEETTGLPVDAVSGAGPYDDTGAQAFDFHQSMLADTARTLAFHEAIVRTVHAGDVVLDIGTGTGILALFAVRAGARHVYAVEQSAVIDLARRVIAANQMEHRVTFIEGLSTGIDLPEPADVLVTETIGNAGFDEGITAWIADAHSRLLTPGASVVPQQIVLEACLVETVRDYAEFERWREPLLRYDFSPLRSVGINNLRPTDLTPLHLVSGPQPILEASLLKPTQALAGSVALEALRAATVHAIGVWFDARLCDGIWLSNRPPSSVPSWQQAILPLPAPVGVVAGDAVAVTIEIGRGGRDWTWQLGGGEPGSTEYGRLDVETG